MGRRQHGRLNGPAGVKRVALIARTLPAGAAVVETPNGGEIVLADGRQATWRCPRPGDGGYAIFGTIADRNRRQKLWFLPRRTKDAIHTACKAR